MLQTTTGHYQGQLQWTQPGCADRLAVSIVCTRLQGQVRKLVTLQSINQALLQQEVQAYQQMTRVLTHEIANSVTPMASLAQSCLHILPQAGHVLSQDDHADLAEALATIDRRCQHLSAFILSIVWIPAAESRFLPSKKCHFTFSGGKKTSMQCTIRTLCLKMV